MKRMLLPAFLVLGLIAVSCGGGDDGPADPGGGGGGGGGNTFTATIGGQAWTADKNLITVSGSDTPTRFGTLVISGVQTSTGTSLSLSLSFIIGPATQPLGVNPGSNPGGTGMLTVAPDIWMTPLSGQAGFITITARTDKRIAGTFNFTADPSLPGPPAKVVTNGAFDITDAAGLPPLPTGVGSTAIATIGGTPWNAATIVGINPGGGIFSIVADNTAYSITILPKVAVVAGNDYGIPSQMGLTVSRTGTADSWAATTGPDIGSVHITTFDADRVWAMFSGILPPLAAASSLTVSGGVINAYLLQ